MVLTVAALVLSIPLVFYICWNIHNVILGWVVRRFWYKDPTSVAPPGRVAVLYLTCDDFRPNALTSLVHQEDKDFDLFVLDDSNDIGEQHRLEEWITTNAPSIKLVRRTDRVGYKGGNLNHWLRLYGNPNVYPYILLADADEYVPFNFLRQLQLAFPADKAFIQANHESVRKELTPFQWITAPHVTAGWQQIHARNFWGLPPNLGHGVLFRTESIRKAGGFAMRISDDMTLTVALANQGLTGIIAPFVTGQEEFPQTYYSFWKRKRKFVLGDAEVVATQLGRLWRSPVRWTGRLDFTLRELRASVQSLSLAVLWILSLGALFESSTILLGVSAWVFALFALSRSLPVLGQAAFPLYRRVLCLLVIPFIGAASLVVGLFATVQGLRGSVLWEPTGSRQVTSASVNQWYFVGELLSAITFMSGGIYSGNQSLTAMGLAVGCSIFMRTSWELPILCVGVFGFWGLILGQFINDLFAGVTPIEHLLALLAL